jgi:hypothetical protein
VTGAIITAPGARAAGLHAGQAGTGLLISHGGFSYHPGFRRFANAVACASDNRNLELVTPGIRHATGQHPGRR